MNKKENMEASGHCLFCTPHLSLTNIRALRANEVHHRPAMSSVGYDGIFFNNEYELGRVCALLCYTCRILKVL